MIPFVGFESPRGTPMAWTKTTRQQYGRDGQRYASDTTAMEWILLSELLPQRGRTGRPPKWHLRTIMDAILYILATGCHCRRTFRHSRRFSITFTIGATAMFGARLIESWSSARAGRQGASPRPRPVSLTARA